MRLLLISSSTVYGRGYLDHAEEEIRDFLGAAGRVLFVPYALDAQQTYTAKARERFAQMGYRIDSLSEARSPKEAVSAAEAIFIGGGNTFRLLRRLYEEDLVDPLRRRVQEGVLYIGSSAGSNVACPTIRTTNDMPIVEPPRFEALALIPFQLNPHYIDADPSSTHMGETREERLAQYHEENDLPVVGLREGAMLRIEGSGVALRGGSGARLFQKGSEPIELTPESSLDFLIK